MQLKNGKFYEVCEGCNEIFELDKESASFPPHYGPEDDFPLEREKRDEIEEYSEGKIQYPHVHVIMPFCPKCRKGGSMITRCNSCQNPLYEEDVLRGRCPWCGFEVGKL